jgi:hypothetical protein
MPALVLTDEEVLTQIETHHKQCELVLVAKLRVANSSAGEPTVNEAKKAAKGHLREQKKALREKANALEKTEILDFIKTNGRRPNHRSDDQYEKALGRTSLNFKTHRWPSYDPHFHQVENDLCRSLGLTETNQFIGIQQKCRYVSDFITANGRLPLCVPHDRKEYEVHVMMDTALLVNKDGCFMRPKDANMMARTIGLHNLDLPTQSRADALNLLVLKYIKEHGFCPPQLGTFLERALFRHIVRRAKKNDRYYDPSFTLNYVNTQRQYCKRLQAKGSNMRSRSKSE